MTFVEHGLVRRVRERALDGLKFGEIASCKIAQHDLRAKPAGTAILDEAGLPFHKWTIPDADRTRSDRRRLVTGDNRRFTDNSDTLFTPAQTKRRGAGRLPIHPEPDRPRSRLLLHQ